MTGQLFVISAPSGTGKTTLLRRVMSRIPSLSFSVSHTTRKPREGEVDGRDYHFVSQSQFERMIDEKKFIEWAKVHDNLYGTSADAVLSKLAANQDVVLDIDVQGAAILRESNRFPAVYLFIAPPGLPKLEERLRGRDTENEQSIQLRLENARIEMQAIDNYEYLIVNDVLEEAVDQLAAVIVAERTRAHRLPDGEPARIELD